MIKRSVLLLSAFALFVGCNEPDPDSISVVDVTTEAEITTIHAGSKSGEYFYKVFANEWSVVSSDEDWCIPQKNVGYKNGEVSSIYVKAYTGDEDSRIATLTFSSGVATQTILVQQVKSDELISLYPSSSTIDYKAQSLSFMVDSNFEWEVTSSVSWVKYSVTDNTVQLNVEENESSTQSREATITVIAYNEEGGSVSTTTATYKLTQQSRSDLYLTPSTSDYTFTPLADVLSVALYTNIYDPAYTVMASSQSDEEWCSATYTDKDGLVITAKANYGAESRKASVSVIARSDKGAGNDTVTAVINLTQEGSSGPVINLGMSSAVYEQAAATHSIKYYTNSSNVVVAANCDWITSIVATRSGVSFAVSENMGAATREAVLTVTSTLGGQSVQKKITVYQNGVGALDLQISPDYIMVDEAGEDNIELSLATNSSATDLDFDWVFPPALREYAKVVVNSGDPKKAMLSVYENDSMYEREFYIVVKLSAGDQTVVKSIRVYQKGKSTTPTLD